MADFGNGQGSETNEDHRRAPYLETSQDTCAVIEIQPTFQHEASGHPGSRRIIPISTIENLPPVTPYPEFQRIGLEILAIADEMYIQQTVELLDLVAAVESENRYLIKIPRGDTIFEAAEKSSKCQRAVMGSARSFELMIFDRSRKEVLHILRMSACTCCFMYCCCLQNVEVYTHQANLLGSIKQEWSMFIPSFIVKNHIGESIYKIEGSNRYMCTNIEDTFKILTYDSTRIVGSISNQWNDVQAQHNLNISFPYEEGANMRAVLLGAAFLLQYMFFEKSKRVRRLRLSRFNQ